MSLENLSFVVGPEPVTDLRDLDAVVTTSAATTDDGDAIPAGTPCTVVSVIRNGFAYAVEFSHPEGAIATLLAADLQRAGISAR